MNKFDFIECKIKRYLSVFDQNSKYMPSILFNTGIRPEYKKVIQQTESEILTHNATHECPGHVVPKSTQR